MSSLKISARSSAILSHPDFLKVTPNLPERSVIPESPLLGWLMWINAHRGCVNSLIFDIALSSTRKTLRRHMSRPAWAPGSAVRQKNVCLSARFKAGPCGGLSNSACLMRSVTHLLLGTHPLCLWVTSRQAKARTVLFVLSFR